MDIIHWGLSKKTVTFEPEIVTNIVSFPPNETYRQIIFFGNRKLCLLQDKIDGSCVLKILHLNSAGRAPENVSILEIKSNSVCRLLVLENPLNIGYIDQSGTVFFMGNKQMSEVYIRKLPGRCPSAQVTMIGSEVCTHSFHEFILTWKVPRHGTCTRRPSILEQAYNIHCMHFFYVDGSLLNLHNEQKFSQDTRSDLL